MSQKLGSSIIHLHMGHCMSSLCLPQTNGLTERFDRTLSDLNLIQYVNSKPLICNEILPFVTFAYKSAMQAITILCCYLSRPKNHIYEPDMIVCG